MHNIRYDKLNVIIHLQNQKSHYKRLFEAKKRIDVDGDNVRTHPSKLWRETDRERKQNNLRLVNQLMKIHNQKGLLQTVETQAKKREHSLKDCGGRNRMLSEKINYDNEKIAERLIEAKPCIGNREEWDRHFRKFKTVEKRIAKF